MKINLFTKKLHRIQEQFNEVFGNHTSNIDERQTVILAICWLGVLAKKITSSKDKVERKDLIDEFNRGKNQINNFFNKKKGEKTCILKESVVTARNISAVKK